MNRITVGLIGDGLSCYRHARAVSTSEHFVLSSIAPKSMEKGREIMRIHNIPHLDRDPEYLLERDDIDAVVIALPTELHMRSAQYAEKHDKIVIIESPVTLSLEEGREIYRKVRDEGSFFFNANPYLYAPALQRMERNSFQTFSLSFSSLYLRESEMLHIALETLVSAFGRIKALVKAGEGEYGAVLERGEGTISLLERSDSYGLTLKAGEKTIFDNDEYYGFLPDFYSYVFHTLETGCSAGNTFFCTLEALSAESKLDTPDNATSAAIEEGRKLISDSEAPEYSNMTELKAMLGD